MKRLLAALGIVTVLVGGAATPALPSSSTWVASYEVPIYDTPSGKLDQDFRSELDPASSTSTKKVAHIVRYEYRSLFSDGHEESLSQGTYRKMGQKGGHAHNPKPSRDSILDRVTPRAHAAISFDAVTSPGNQNTTSYTFAHTTTGTDNFIVLAMFRNGSSDVSGITYNGDALTKKGESDVWEFWYRFDADAGTNNVVISRGSAQALNPTVATYKCVDTSGFDTNETVTAHGGSTTSWSRNTTTLTNNSWAIAGWGGTTAQTATAGTKRGQGSGDSGAIFDNGPKTPAGSVTISATSAASDTKTWIFSVKPSSAAACNVAPTPPESYIMIIE